MLFTGVKSFLRWSLLTIALFSVGFILLISAARFTPVSLSLAEGAIASIIGRATNTQIEIDNAYLLWSSDQDFPALQIGRLEIIDSDQSQAIIGDLYVAPSRRAFFDHFSLALHELSIASVDIAASSERNIAPPIGLTFAAADERDMVWADYLLQIDVRNISIAAFGETIDDNDLGGSYISVSRDADALIGALDVSFYKNKILTRVDGQMNFRPGEKGFFELNLHRVNPDDIGNISRLFEPLRALSLPISGKVTFDVDGQGHLQKGRAEIAVLPGVVNLSTANVKVNDVDVTVEADFVARDFTLSKGNFDIAGAKGEVTGKLFYEFSDAGHVTDVSASLTSDNLVLHRPKLFEAPIIASKVTAQLNYNLVNQSLLIDLFDIVHGDGTASTSGLIEFANGVQFDIATQFGTMTREAVMRLWPLPAGPRSRQWASENLSRGKLLDGRLALRASLDELVNRQRGTPLRQEALQLDLTISDIDIRYLKTMPPITGTLAELKLGGRGLTVTAKGGKVVLPEYQSETPPPLVLHTGEFSIENYRAPGAPSTVQLNADGQIRAVLRELNKPPLAIMRKVKFDAERLQGDFSGTVDLALNLDNRTLKQPVKYEFNGQSTNLSVTGQLGNFSLSDGRVMASLDNQKMTIMGRAKANDSDLGFEWRQDLATDGRQPAQSRLAIHGQLSPQELANLGYPWAAQRMTGTAHLNVLAEGPIERPTSYRVMADLKEATLMPLPLAYQKPAGQAAHIKAVVNIGNKGKISDLRTRGFVDGKQVLAAQLGFSNGIIDTIEMEPITLGRTKGLTVNLVSGKQSRHLTLSGKQFDAAALVAAGNAEVNIPKGRRTSLFEFLGQNIVIEAQIDKTVGAHDETLDAFKFRAVRSNGLFEKASLSGVFGDGTELLGAVDRIDVAARQFSLQTENASSFFRLINVLDGVIGGALVLQGNIFDDERNDNGDYMQASGRFDLVSFRARKVPTLAKILSIASFQGFADTLAGEGIQFDRAEFKFTTVDNLFRVKGGRIFGPAIGLTIQGDYDMNDTKINFGGTVVPAYGINSFLSNVPVVGRVLTGRKGEGVLGVGYRLIGRSGDPTVIVNPLSILTPGIFRRIFEVGIGLTPDGAPPIQDTYPEGSE